MEMVLSTLSLIKSIETPLSRRNHRVVLVIIFIGENEEARFKPDTVLDGW